MPLFAQGFFISGQFYLKVHTNSSHFVSPFSLHLLTPLSPCYTCWHNVACYWVIALTADSAIHSSATLPFLLGVIQSSAFALGLHQEVNKERRKPSKTHWHTLLFLWLVIWSVISMLSALWVKWQKLCLLVRYLLTKIPGWLVQFVNSSSAKRKKAEASGEQHGVDFGGLGSGATALGRGHHSSLPLERPNIPKDEHPAEVNRERQVS